MLNRLLTILLLVAGVLLLAESVSGFVSDAEISSERLGSDFSDAKFRHFDGLSIERAQQRSRRETTGLEAVGGLGLLVVAMIFHTPSPRRVRPVRVAEQGSGSSLRDGDTERRLAGPKIRQAEAPPVVRRRRPDSRVYEAPPRKVG
jgi:hypothetical protein